VFGLPILATSLNILTDRYIYVKLLMGHHTSRLLKKPFNRLLPHSCLSQTSPGAVAPPSPSRRGGKGRRTSPVGREDEGKQPVFGSRVLKENPLSFGIGTFSTPC
jgi:hypothetical protein